MRILVVAVFCLVVAPACTSTVDGGAEPADAGSVVHFDGGEDAGHGDAGHDADAGQDADAGLVCAEVEGDISTRAPCNTVCASRSLNCDPNCPWDGGPPYGWNGAGEAHYEQRVSQEMMTCEEQPEASTRWNGSAELALLGYTCACH